MNERIQQLAEQAKKYALDAMIKITDKEQALKVYSETYDTKFAELIIDECLRMCDCADVSFLEHHYSREADGASSVKIFIKEHFGVEE